jgi:endonuclease G
MGVLDDLLRARERFDDWSDIQHAAQQRRDDPRIEAEQANARTRFLRPDDPAFAERVFEASDLMPVRYLALGQWAARPVGRIHLRSTGEGDAFATGFLVAPGLLLTNWHVLKSRDHAAAARVVFDAEDDVDGRPRPAQEFALDPDAAFVTDPRLDFCFVGVRDRSTGGVALSRYGYLRLYEATGKVMRGEYATIIQHPHGRQKHIALRENRIEVYVYDAEAGKDAADNDYLYYRTDTAQGSSGAPVLNDQWYVIALHRRGVPKTRRQLRAGYKRKPGRKPRPADYEDVVLRRDGTPAREGDPDSIIAYVANEGVRVSRILRRLDTLGRLRDADAEHARAIAGRVRSVAKDLSLGPFERPTATRAAGPRRMPRDANGEALELVRRDLTAFPAIGELGYDPDFLGIPVPLPVPRPELRRELAMRLDDPTRYLLEFRHFTTCMHARRRLPVFAAANLGTVGKPHTLPKNRPQWSIDPRIAEDHQPDDSIFSSMLQRGHLAARDIVLWGRTASARNEADRHSFTLTNACPQLAKFNSSGGEWWKVERAIEESLATAGKASLFAGPVFRADDQDYDDLRSGDSDANEGTGIRIPTRFWMIVAWVDHGELRRRAFVLDQRAELRAVVEGGGLEMEFDVPTGVSESTVGKVGRMTDLGFGR